MAEQLCAEHVAGWRDHPDRGRPTGFWPKVIALITRLDELVLQPITSLQTRPNTTAGTFRSEPIFPRQINDLAESP